MAGEGKTREVTIGGSYLSRKEALFIRSLEAGLPPAAAAAKAGYSNPAATARALMLRTHIQDEVAFVQAKMAEATGMSRHKVHMMLKQAYELAIEKEDANAIVRVASELNKMCGYYAVPGSTGSDQAKALENAMTVPDTDNMTDEELEALATAEERLKSEE